MGASSYLQNAVIDQWFRTRTVAKPTHLYVALTVAGVEVAGASYARVQNDPLDTNWTATQGGTSGNSTGTSGKTTNAVTLTYPAPLEDWGLVDGVAIYDAASSGNLIGTGSLTLPALIKAGDQAPSFAPGTMEVTVA